MAIRTALAAPTLELEPAVRRASDVAKTRKCLVCRDDFDSAWSGERICRRCKGRGDWRGCAPASFGHPGRR